MKLRYKKDGSEAASSQFNIHALDEIIAFFANDMDTMFIKDFDVWLEKTTPPGWKDMSEAFRDHDLITDDYNTRFFEPTNDDDRKRGFAY